ncbi:MAG: glutathionylspermidine synthase family protein [Candidatus Celaenobacter polaris]|nr:glutathionylspermidine synthase family protein [Candidatus Celaenobacter polaris]
MNSILPIYKEYSKEILEHPKKYYGDFTLVENAVANSTALYKGKPIDFHYQPMFFFQGDVRRFEYLVTTFSSILKKVIDEYVRNPVFRSYFDFPSLMEELILIDPGYSMPFPIARFDIFYSYDDDFKFCELNTDGTSGMNESNPIEKAVLSSQILKVLQKKYRISYFELFLPWIEELLGCYAEFSDSSHSKPNIAIMDWEGVATIEEFKVFQQMLMQRGYKTVICDPCELTYKQNKLYYNAIPIDLIYRRSLTFEICERADEVKDLLSAHKDGNVCMVGPFRSHVIHNKRIFSILRDTKKTLFLNDEEQKFVRLHIPFTKELSDPDAENRARTSKDEYILKPMDRYAAKGVFVGVDHTQEEWERTIDSIQDKDSYLVQQFIEPPKIPCITFRDEKPFVEEYKYITGLFVYNGRFHGLYTRAGMSNVIASVTGCRIMPNLYVREV